MSKEHFSCVACGAPVAAWEDRAPRQGYCRKCEPDGRVPGLPKWPARIVAVDLKFFCGRCEGELQIDARWEGAVVECPRCRETTEVPVWSGVSKPGITLSPDEVQFLSDPAVGVP